MSASLLDHICVRTCGECPEFSRPACEAHPKVSSNGCNLGFEPEVSDDGRRAIRNAPCEDPRLRQPIGNTRRCHSPCGRGAGSTSHIPAKACRSARQRLHGCPRSAQNGHSFCDCTATRDPNVGRKAGHRCVCKANSKANEERTLSFLDN